MAACGSDDDAPAEPTGSASSVPDAPDASVRELRGDGLEPTPDFDIEVRQRDPIGPEQRNESIDRLLNGAAGGYNGPDAAAPSDEADAGAVNGTN